MSFNTDGKCVAHLLLENVLQNNLLLKVEYGYSFLWQYIREVAQFCTASYKLNLLIMTAIKMIPHFFAVLMVPLNSLTFSNRAILHSTAEIQ